MQLKFSNWQISKRTLRFLANEWLEQWTQGFENLYCSARQIVPRRVLIVPHEIRVKNRSERWLANCEFQWVLITEPIDERYPVWKIVIDSCHGLCQYSLISNALLCMGKEVPRNPPALHAGPPRFFARTKKLSKKCFTISSLRGVSTTFSCYRTT